MPKGATLTLPLTAFDADGAVRASVGSRAVTIRQAPDPRLIGTPKVSAGPKGIVVALDPTNAADQGTTVTLTWTLQRDGRTVARGSGDVFLGERRGTLSDAVKGARRGDVVTGTLVVRTGDGRSNTRAVRAVVR